jgi:hypothetical protein
MKRLAVRIAIASVLVITGWVLAKAQSSQPDFEIIVSSPGGNTTVECRRGCELSWFERGLNPRAATMKTFSFACTSAERCASGVIGGWIR